MSELTRSVQMGFWGAELQPVESQEDRNWAAKQARRASNFLKLSAGQHPMSDEFYDDYYREIYAALLQRGTRRTRP